MDVESKIALSLTVLLFGSIGILVLRLDEPIIQGLIYGAFFGTVFTYIWTRKGNKKE